MERRILGRCGLRASVVGFGGIPLQGISWDEAQRVLLGALDRGINFFDTARGYTDSEEKIGRALAGRRSELILATKAMSRDAAGMAREFETSLHNLRTEVIDLYQIHGLASFEQLDQVLGPGGAYQALDRARSENRLRFIGVTGHGREVLKQAVETGRFDTVQFPFNPLETEWADEVIPAAKRAGVGIIGMKPLAGGALLDVPAALRFSLDRGIQVVIPGMDSVLQVEQNAAVGRDLRPPSRAELSRLDREKALWGGRFCRRCGYCQPCPNGLNIPMLLLLQAYHERYRLVDWARERLAGLEKKYLDCDGCGDCQERCPYHLPIPELMKRASEQMGG